MEEMEKLIEAILFMSSRPVSIHDLTKATGTDLRTLKVSIKNLQTEFELRGSWMEVIQTDKSYLLRLKPAYTDKISGMVQETELSKRAIRVLSIVAKHDGILQSRLAKSLGPTVYEGVQELLDKGYLIAQLKGHSKSLKLSQKFKTYFGEIPLGTQEAPQAVGTATAPAEETTQEGGAQQ